MVIRFKKFNYFVLKFNPTYSANNILTYIKSNNYNGFTPNSRFKNFRKPSKCTSEILLKN